MKGFTVLEYPSAGTGGLSESLSNSCSKTKLRQEFDRLSHNPLYILLRESPPLGRCLSVVSCDTHVPIQDERYGKLRYHMHSFRIVLASCGDKRSVSTDIEHFVLVGARREGEIGKLG